MRDFHAIDVNTLGHDNQPCWVVFDAGHDGFFGDRRYWPGPASTIGPLDRPTFYAVRLHSGTLGTKGGPHTDADGAVLDVDGAVVQLPSGTGGRPSLSRARQHIVRHGPLSGATSPSATTSFGCLHRPGLGYS